MNPSPKIVTIEVDTREKRPILFPATIAWRGDRADWDGHIVKVKAVRRKLDAGDYRLASINGQEIVRACTVERKNRASELYTNLCTKDWIRAGKAFGKFGKLPGVKYLLVEESLSRLTAFERQAELSSGILLDRLIQVTATLGVRLLMVPGCHLGPARYRLGEFIVRLMLGHAYHPQRNLEREV